MGYALNVYGRGRMLTPVSASQPPPIASNIVALRKAAGYEDRAKFARAIEVNYQQVTAWETTATVIELPNLIKLALFFRVRIADIIRGFDPRYDSLDSDLIRHGGTGASALPREVPDVSPAAGSLQLDANTLSELERLAKRFARVVASIEDRRTYGKAGSHRAPAASKRKARRGHG